MTRSISRAGMTAILLCSGAASAQTGLDAAEDTDTAIPGDFELSGNVGFVSDYRFRGLSFSDEDLALQGGIDLAHRSGFYVGAWGSNLGGFGTFGDPNLELDLYGGYGAEFGGIGVFDVGVLYYLYPGAAGNNDYIEIYGSVGAEIAGAETTVGIAYAPDQDSIGGDNLYVFGDLGAGIPGTPFSVTGHLGYTEGSLGLGSTAFDDNYIDYSLGVSTTWSGIDLGLSYVDTDVSKARETAVGTRVLGSGQPYIADDTLVVSVGYSF